MAKINCFERIFDTTVDEGVDEIFSSTYAFVEVVVLTKPGRVRAAYAEHLSCLMILLAFMVETFAEI